MAGSSVNSSSNTSQSSTGVSPDMAAYMAQLNGYANNLQTNANNVYNSAGSSIGGIINNGLLPAAGTALNGANTAGALYQGYAPGDAAALHTYTNNLNDPSAIAANYMNPAEANVASAGDAARKNSESALQAYGVDPSSGRYAALDSASRLATAGNAAGAGNQARIAALNQYGTMLGQEQGYNAQNAQLANAGLSTAGNLLGAATNANLGLGNLGIAAGNASNSIREGLLHPGTVSQSNSSGSSSGSSSSSDPSSDGSGGSKAGGNQGAGGGGSGPGGGSGYNGAPSGAGSSGGGSDNPFYNSGGGGSGGNYTDSNGYSPGDQYYDPYGATGSLGDNTGSGSSSTDSSGGYGGYYDPYSATGDLSGGGTGYDASTYDTGGGGIDYSSWTGGDSTGAATGGPIGEEYYAQGGGVLPDDSTTGGTVPQTASPSMGGRTDDVNARLNVGEFVIPKDVTAWKGQEFFQKLIKQSREARLGAPATPQKKPALAGAPNFISQRMSP